MGFRGSLTLLLSVVSIVVVFSIVIFQRTTYGSPRSRCSPVLRVRCRFSRCSTRSSRVRMASCRRRTSGYDVMELSHDMLNDLFFPLLQYRLKVHFEKTFHDIKHIRLPFNFKKLLLVIRLRVIIAAIGLQFERVAVCSINGSISSLEPIIMCATDTSYQLNLPRSSKLTAHFPPRLEALCYLDGQRLAACQLKYSDDQHPAFPEDRLVSQGLAGSVSQ